MKTSRILFLTFVLGAVSSALAVLKENPDPNTLWIEDGKPEIKIVPKGKGGGWGDGLGGIANPEGGFFFESVSEAVTSTGHYVPMHKEYPWLVYRITMTEPKGKYKSLGFNKFESWQTGIFQTGVFTVKRTDLPDTKKTNYIQFYLYGLKVHFDYIKMVKVPENYVEVESEGFAKGHFTTGDKIKITVHLQENAEDVSIQFVEGLRMMRLKLNGTDKLQLKPVNGDEKTWSGECEVKIDKMSKSTCWFKAVILGGNHPEPLWGSTPVRFKAPEAQQ